MGRCGENFELILDEKEVFAGFSTRISGVSSGAYNGLNLAYHVGDDENAVAKNREILMRNLAKFSIKSSENLSKFDTEIDTNLVSNFQNPAREILAVNLNKFDTNLAKNSSNSNTQILKPNLIFLNQTHSDKISIFNHKIAPISTKFYADADAIITREKGAILCIMSADCAGILLYDRVNLVIAAIHAGRAGVMQQITSKTISKMTSEFGTRPRDLWCFVGPHILGGCYECECDLGEWERYKNGANFDINLALSDEFHACGVLNFHFSPICSHCDKRFFSYRREKITGRFANFIGLKI